MVYEFRQTMPKVKGFKKRAANEPTEEQYTRHLIEKLRSENEADKIDEEEMEEEEISQIKIRHAGRMVQMRKLGQILLKIMSRRNAIKNKNLVTIGMLGFPNVGKSSVINVLCGKKLVGVDSRPGKTKNFQTIYLEDDLLLCDCPGLVFPSVVASKAQMVCNGVVPISNLREYMPPVAYIVDKIPVKVFEFVFRFHCPLEADAVFEPGRLLHTFAVSRGYIRPGSGTPNYHAAACFMLKRLVKGELLLAKLPNDEGFVSNDVPDNYNPFISTDANHDTDK